MSKLGFKFFHLLLNYCLKLFLQSLKLNHTCIGLLWSNFLFFRSLLFFQTRRNTTWWHRRFKFFWSVCSWRFKVKLISVSRSRSWSGIFVIFILYVLAYCLKLFLFSLKFKLNLRWTWIFVMDWSLQLLHY